MIEQATMTDEQLIEKVVTVLVREIGPVEAGRFLAIQHKTRMDSVKRHHAWQAGLDKEQFFSRVFDD